MAKKILSIALALIMALSVFAVAASAASVEVAMNATFADVIENAQQGDTVILIEDIELDAYVEVVGDNLTIDLAGNDIIASSNTALDVYGTVTFIDSVGGGSVTANTTAVCVNDDTTVTIEAGTFNGAVKAMGEDAVVVINDGTFVAGSNDDAVEGFNGGQVTINDGTFNGDLYFKGHGDLTINGGTFTSSTNIWGHGNDLVGSDVTINGGTFVATGEDGANIYKPSVGTLTINGGTFTGSSNVYTKAGDTIINGGTFTATRDKVAFVHNGSGFEPTGDCIVIEACTGYEGPPTLKVYGGTFESENAEIIGAYEYGMQFENTYFVENDDIAADVDAAYVSKYVVNETTGVEYAKLADAAAAVNDGETLALINDVVVPAYVTIDAEDVTIDLAGKSITSSGNTALDLYGSFTIVDTVGGGEIAAVARGIWVNPDAVVELDGATVNGIVVEGAEFTMTSGTVNGDIYGSDAAEITIEDGAVNGTVCVYNEGTTLTINGGTFTDPDYAVSGIGNADDCGTIITINGGTFKATDPVEGAALFQPQSGTTTINGGTFIGADAIYQKSGDIIINGGKFTGNGAKVAYTHKGGGFKPTGDTIVIESCAYPGGAPSLEINGGSFYSVNNEIIGYYVYGDNALDDTGFINDGYFDKVVPAEYFAGENAFNLLMVVNGKATFDEAENLITITADAGVEKVEVLKKVAGNQEATFSDLTGGAKLSSGDQVFARTNGTFKVTIGETTYDAQIVFGSYDVEDLLVVEGATMSVNDDVITLTATAAQINIANRTSFNTDVALTAGSLAGGARATASGTIYAKRNGSAEITVPNSGVYTVNFVFASAAADLLANLIYDNATASISGSTITLTPDGNGTPSLAPFLADDTAISFSDLAYGAIVSSGGSLYANRYAEATATIDGADYDVVFAFADPEAALAANLRVANATATVANGVITLTPNGNGTPSLVCKLADGTAVTFSNLADGAKISGGGSLYANRAATATATIDGTAYTVVFAFADPDAALAANLRIANCTAEVANGVITLTPDGNGTPSLVCKLTDGTAVTFSDLALGAKISGGGSLYANRYATATATIDGVDYDVVFAFADPAAALAANLRVTNATATVANGVITLTPDGNGTPSLVCKLTDGTAVTFSNLASGAKISGGGSLYASRNTTATATIDGTAYTVVFDFGDPDEALAATLRTVNATVEIENGVITLTPVNEAAQMNLVNKLTDGTSITFSELSANAKLASTGTLYAKNAATATATIGGVDYEVVFDFAQKTAVDLLDIVNGTATVSGTVVTITPASGATQVNVKPVLKDGNALEIVSAGSAKISSKGVLYAKTTATAYAFVNIEGVRYTVIFQKAV